MNDYTNESMRLRGRRQGGPPLVLLGALVLAFFVLGMVAAAALGGITPNPLGSPQTVSGFYRVHGASAVAGAIFLFASSVPLLLYAATASARLRQLGVTAPGATIALAGGVVASAMLSLSAMLGWVLSRPTVVSDDALVHGLSTLSFLVGGVAHVVPLGLLVAGIAVPALILRLLPLALAWAGLVIAAVAELSTLSLVVPALAVLLPIARFPALIWLVVAGALLPNDRRRVDTR
ncbi:MAG TPA: hypothetical protein VE908_10480 [Mycobacterium sp.]|nr:hypothetical protein [Mycobacterium sp.]